MSDRSRENVERVAQELEKWSLGTGLPELTGLARAQNEAPALLRALLTRAETAERERDAPMAENERLRRALLLCDRDCEHLHHEPKHRHQGGDCPVEAIVAEALRGPEEQP